jgi:hypothetical protein
VERDGAAGAATAPRAQAAAALAARLRWSPGLLGWQPSELSPLRGSRWLAELADAQEQQRADWASLLEHLQGAASGRELPFFAWDLSSGDWRAAHFVGLHALQALPGLAWLAACVTTNLLPSARRWALLGAIAYAALFAAVVMWTAAGRSVVALDRPGGWWVGAPAGMYGLAAVSLCVVVVLSIRRQPAGAGLGVARGANSDQ